MAKTRNRKPTLLQDLRLVEDLVARDRLLIWVDEDAMRGDDGRCGCCNQPVSPRKKLASLMFAGGDLVVEGTNGDSVQVVCDWNIRGDPENDEVSLHRSCYNELVEEHEKGKVKR